MTKEWRPHVDLARLSAALSEDIVAAPEAELRALLADPALPAAAIVKQARAVVANAIGETDESKPALIGRDRERHPFLAI
jgi:hypothetical protein